MASDSSAPSFRRSKPLLIIAGVVVIVLAALVAWWLISQSTLESELAALRAKGLPTTASEVNDFYAVPDGVADSTDLWVKAIDAVAAADLESRGGELPFVGQGPAPVPASREEWAEFDASRKFVAELDDELQAIHRAAAAGGQVRFPVDFSAGIQTLLPDTQASRDVARLLMLDAHVSARDGDGSRALEDVKAMLALSDALRGEPVLISQLVRIANHTLGCQTAEAVLPLCTWSDQELDSLQSSIRSARFKDEMANAMCGERAILLSTMAGITLGPFQHSNAREALRVFKSSIDGLSRPWPDALLRQREISNYMQTVNQSTITRIRLAGVVLMLPALEQAAITAARAEARRRCANAALAVERLRRAQRELPKFLAEVDPALLGSTSGLSTELADPFNGEPLRYIIEESRIVIYSVGENGRDDGGDCQGDAQRYPLDVGFELKR